jgi:hypothetical protein
MEGKQDRMPEHTNMKPSHYFGKRFSNINIPQIEFQGLLQMGNYRKNPDLLNGFSIHIERHR